MCFLRCKELPEYDSSPIKPNSTQRKIGQYVASLVEDGSTLQIGIGPIPNAFFDSLHNHKDLGIHSELIPYIIYDFINVYSLVFSFYSEGIVDLVEKGVITNSKKVKHMGKTVGSLAYGSNKLLSFINNNPTVWLYCSEYVNNTSVIRENPRVCSINPALEVDLTGQISTNRFGTIGNESHPSIEDVGGKMDFMRGAALSKGGKPIITLESTKSSNNEDQKLKSSRIVPTLDLNSVVSSTRAHVHHVVTEYGHVDLYGKTLRQRAKLLISVAHPDFRQDLERKAWERFGNLDL